ncbi:SpoIIE family protein phosphatase [Streptomyces sp. TRM 70351]|nr:SpoIIE family protein phosphatase [Streptomyces sp. TRM 70351]MEE1926749.1 SpoIIE family protein phosphatase [Streptomyces sp. TRM 70351]
MFLWQLAVTAVLVAGALLALVLQARIDSRDHAVNRSLAAAGAFAQAPGTAEALRSPDPTARLQPRAEAARRDAQVDFVAVLGRDGVRYTDPVPELIGERADGDLSRVLAGETLTDTHQSEPGQAVRAVVPVTDDGGTVVGMVSAGLQTESVGDMVDRQLPVLLAAAAGALVLSTGGAALVSRRLRRQTHGLGPVEMTRVYEHHKAVLHAVREGVLILDAQRRLALANDEARRLLDLGPRPEGRSLDGLGLGNDLTALLRSGRSCTDEVHPAGDRLLAVNVRPTAVHGGPAGSVVTLRDTTELRAVSGRAEVARGRLALVYEAGVRIGTTLDVVRTAGELAEVAVPRFADFVTVDLLDSVLRGDEPSGAGAELRRTAFAGHRADHPFLPVGTPVPGTVPAAPAAFRDVPGDDPQWAEQARAHGLHAHASVPLRVRGVALGRVGFWRAGRPEPFEQDDLAVADELAARAAVCIDNARRYTREHHIAVALQRSLLPRDVPGQNALEVAHRYLPAEAGVGGDWFDVIPLPGARVALVVGDVVGHGLHAAATMGRLRTAVLNFSALDLPPEEIVGHLDELVTGLDQDRAAADDSTQITGATCLYAVYDPTSGRCTLARAGHPGPALVSPAGEVHFPEVPVSPPLGLGGLPCETAELRLAEGTRLVLYTDGLVRSRDRDLGNGLDLLGQALADRGTRTPEETCRAVVAAMLSERREDDVALLVARTRLLDAGQSARWEVPRDPAAVTRLRADVGAQLLDWGLEELAFTTELILSELVTNAIRYGGEPIRVRLLRDRSLICEVADGSSTSPHLRRAATTDEGGRGLFLVARLAQRWGTRYTADGKVIWTEQPLQDGRPVPAAPLFDDLL